ncbi:PQQ-binding-like beta-propeller repeat protein [Streptomyces sp. NRRL S-813]|uniref:PQQ-binding-like beta-propeller repeat protein n=1 Tax=Streptomyces sp. NRRL S-813 TaxID=1463919 RepID=UPI0004C1CCAF|nr:PQQ-binding-like beta-propeller repeat protein [Streptomyces sp. NRRL S-813]
MDGVPPSGVAGRATRTRWHFSARGKGSTSSLFVEGITSSPVVDNGTVYVVSEGKNVYAVQT